MIMERQKLDPAPKYNQKWRTKHGHLVRILISAAPAPRTIIETEYVNGRVDGYLGANFHLDGHAVMGDDMLVERVK